MSVKNNKANLLIFGKQNEIFRQLQFDEPSEKIFLNFRVQHVDHKAGFSQLSLIHLSILQHHISSINIRCINPVFFSQGSMEHKGSANGIEWFHRIEARNGNATTFAATIDVFPGLLVRPKCICGGGLQRSLRPTSLLPPLQEPLPRSWPSASNSQCPQRQIAGYTHGFREQAKLLQRVPLQTKGSKALH